MLDGRFGGRDVSEVEIFTPTGVLAGTTSDLQLVYGGADLASPLALEEARWYPLDGSPPTHRGAVTVPPDDLLVIVAGEPELKIHMAWYSVALELGPYRVTGSMATLPGFDPAKAIARPSGSFVALSDATIELVNQDGAGRATREHLLVNRYAVDRVTSTLMLGHFFPGAQLVAHEAVPVA